MKVRWPRAVPAVLALAVVLRVVVALALGDRAEPVSGAADQVSYDVLAQRVLAGHGFSFPTGWYPFTEADRPTAHWSFLYTLYLATVYAVVGHHPLAARLVQAVLSSAGCWLVYRLAARVFDRRVGLAAAALTAVYGYFVFFGAALMTQAFYIVALLAALDTAFTVRERPTAAGWVALGVALGVGTLLRQTLLLFAPFLLAWAAAAPGVRSRWRGALGSLAVLLLCVLPWTVRNYAVFGQFLLLNSNGGYWLYCANHPGQGTRFDPTFTAPPPARLAHLEEPALDRALFREGLGFMRDDPGRVARLTLSRIPAYLWALPSSESSLLANVGRVGSFTLCLPLMLAGVALSAPRWRRCLPLYLYVLLDGVFHLLTWAAPRYRLPSDAVMMVFAGLTVERLRARLTGT